MAPPFLVGLLTCKNTENLSRTIVMILGIKYSMSELGIKEVLGDTQTEQNIMQQPFRVLL